MMCKKCGAVSGILFLVLGLLYLLVDVGVWSFWGIQWYSTLFILLGVITLASGHCSDCKAMRKK